MNFADSSPVLNILLATCRGARFLPDLLDSLRAQQDPAWRVFVRDDASDDGTQEILSRHAALDPRIVIIRDTAARLGVKGNFAALLTHFLASGEQWFALCDQDDIWLPHKVARLRRALAENERAGEARLVYSDLAWIDASGRTLAASHFARIGLRDGSRAAGVNVLLHNLVPGCAMAGNRALVERALPLPESAEYHDWWLLLTGAALGRVCAIPEVLIGYRQHSANVTGASSPLLRAWRLLTRPALLWMHARRQYWNAAVQAHALTERIGETPLDPAWEAALRWCREGLGASSRRARLQALLAAPVRCHGFLRNVFLFVGAWMKPPRR